MKKGPCRAFARVELAAVTGICVIAAAVLIVAGAGQRREARLASDLSNLGRIAGHTGAYAADNGDQYWAYSWQRRKVGDPPYPTVYPDLREWAVDDVGAGARQAVDILRRVADREDIARIDGWIANVMFSHLPLLDYLKITPGDPMFISAADRHRLQWSRDPAGFDEGRYLPIQPAPSNTNKRWPYGASYLIPPGFYDQSAVGSRLNQEGNPHFLYWVPGGVTLFGKRTSQVAFPANKVHLYDQASRHSDRRGAFFAVPSAKVATLMADGSAGLRRTADANYGWRPNTPDRNPTLMTYQPAAFEVPTTNGQPSESVRGMYRWTREGVGGRDFGGPEVGP